MKVVHATVNCMIVHACLLTVLCMYVLSHCALMHKSAVDAVHACLFVQRA